MGGRIGVKPVRIFGTLLAAATIWFAIAAAHAETLVTAGPRPYSESITSSAVVVGAEFSWHGAADLKVTVDYDARRDALTLRCTGRGIAHLRILTGRRLLMRATCTGQNALARGILRHPPMPLTVTGVIRS